MSLVPAETCWKRQIKSKKFIIWLHFAPTAFNLFDLPQRRRMSTKEKLDVTIRCSSTSSPMLTACERIWLKTHCFRDADDAWTSWPLKILKDHQRSTIIYGLSSYTYAGSTVAILLAESSNCMRYFTVQPQSTSRTEQATTIAGILTTIVSKTLTGGCLPTG